MADQESKDERLKALEEKVKQLEEKNLRLQEDDIEKEKQVQYVEAQFKEATQKEEKTAAALEEEQKRAKQLEADIQESNSKASDFETQMYDARGRLSRKQTDLAEANRRITELQRKLKDANFQSAKKDEAKAYVDNRLRECEVAYMEQKKSIDNFNVWAQDLNAFRPKAEAFDAMVVERDQALHKCEELQRVLENREVVMNRLSMEPAQIDKDPNDDSSDSDEDKGNSNGKANKGQNGKIPKRNDTDDGELNLYSVSPKRSKPPTKNLAEELNPSDFEDENGVEEHDEPVVNGQNSDKEQELELSRIEMQGVLPVSASEHIINPPTLAITSVLEKQGTTPVIPSTRLTFVPIVASEQIQPIASPVPPLSPLTLSRVHKIVDVIPVPTSEQKRSTPLLSVSSIGGIQQTLPLASPAQQPIAPSQLTASRVHIVSDITPVSPPSETDSTPMLSVSRIGGIQQTLPLSPPRHQPPTPPRLGFTDITITHEITPVSESAQTISVQDLIFSSIMTEHSTPETGYNLGAYQSIEPFPFAPEYVFDVPAAMQETAPQNQTAAITAESATSNYILRPARELVADCLIGMWSIDPHTQSSTTTEFVDVPSKPDPISRERVVDGSEAGKRDKIIEATAALATPIITSNISLQADHHPFNCWFQIDRRFFLLFLLLITQWLGVEDLFLSDTASPVMPLLSMEHTPENGNESEIMEAEVELEMLSESMSSEAAIIPDAKGKVPSNPFARHGSSHATTRSDQPSTNSIKETQQTTPCMTERQFVRANWGRITCYFILHAAFYYLFLISIHTLSQRALWFHANERTHTVLTDMFAYRRNVNSPDFFSPRRWFPGNMINAVRVLAIGVAETGGYEARGFRVPG